MANFYRVQIDTIYLTSNGENTGKSCKLEVTNWEDLLTTVAGNVRPNADGSPDIQLYEWSAGKQFDIRVEVLFLAQWNDLKDLLLDSLENATSWTIAGTGDFGNFSVTARAFPDKAFTAQSFHNGVLSGVNLRFITT